MRFMFEEESESDLEATSFLGSKGCGLYKPKRSVSLISESLLGESLLGGESKKEEKEIRDLWGNYQQCRYQILSQGKDGISVLLHPAGHEFEVVTCELQDVGTHRESEKERVWGSCGLPWSICVVGGRKPDGTPY